MTREQEIDSVRGLGEPDYVVFIPRNADEFAIGHEPIMREMGIGYPHEIEVFYGTSEECKLFVKNSDFSNMQLSRFNEDHGNMRIDTPEEFKALELDGTYEVIATGNYREMHARCVQLWMEQNVPSSQEDDKGDLPF